MILVFAEDGQLKEIDTSGIRENIPADVLAELRVRYRSYEESRQDSIANPHQWGPYSTGHIYGELASFVEVMILLGLYEDVIND